MSLALCNTDCSHGLLQADLSHVSDPDARDLIGKLLSADPADRLNAEEALLHPFILKYSSHEVLNPQLTAQSEIANLV